MSTVVLICCVSIRLTCFFSFSWLANADSPMFDTSNVFMQTLHFALYLSLSRSNHNLYEGFSNQRSLNKHFPGMCPKIELNFYASVIPKNRTKPCVKGGQGHSRPQSLRFFWPAAGIESSGSNHFEITKEITEFCPSGLSWSSFTAHVRNGCSQSSRFLPQARRIVGYGDENGSRVDSRVKVLLRMII